MRRKRSGGGGSCASAATHTGPDPAPTTFRVKVISLGDSQVGKSCLIKRYCERRFVERYVQTIGIDFGVKHVSAGSKKLKVNFFDMSGKASFEETRAEFYADTQGMLICYDVSSVASFDALDGWLAEAKRNGLPASACGVVCATKQEEGSGRRRQVDAMDGRDWAREHGYDFFETSANTGANVDEAVQRLLEHVVRSIDAEIAAAST